MDRAKFEQMVELFNEGKSSDVISKAIRASSAIVDWFLLFIKVHGVEITRLFLYGIGRHSYTKEQLLGIYNFVLASNCGFDRAEVYFKIKRNTLLARVKRYIGKENIGKVAADAVPMYPDVPRDCDEIIAALSDEVLGLSANSPKSLFKGITKEELLNSPLVKSLEAHEFKEAQMANAQEPHEAQMANAQAAPKAKKVKAHGAPKAKKVNTQKSPKAHKENTQEAQWDKPLVANDEFSYHDNPLLKSKATDSNDKFSYRDNPLLKYKATDSNEEASQADESNSIPPRIFGRAVAPLKKYKKKNKDRS
ncbi:MAG: hypothetical protein SOV16_04470 [Anaerobiospirillum succiniciproducens]|uniref:hypothetical protein n=1 Tax=Anaerobiospirillum succiniciproducens TaxID=13335 RepID=UPI002A757E46|nr:hypothetical protein [Anaerobiospirillum succiniciproducens]MDY2798415.1 hypothetical protein [Anaerobiospirillum succiniciproducens]